MNSKKNVRAGWISTKYPRGVRVQNEKTKGWNFSKKSRTAFHARDLAYAKCGILNEMSHGLLAYVAQEQFDQLVKHNDAAVAKGPPARRAQDTRERGPPAPRADPETPDKKKKAKKSTSQRMTDRILTTLGISTEEYQAAATAKKAGATPSIQPTGQPTPPVTTHPAPVPGIVWAPIPEALAGRKMFVAPPEQAPIATHTAPDPARAATIPAGPSAAATFAQQAVNNIAARDQAAARSAVPSGPVPGAVEIGTVPGYVARKNVARSARALDDEPPIIMFDSGTSRHAVPADLLDFKPDTKMTVGEMSQTTVVPVSSERQNGIAECMALPKAAGPEICIAPKQLVDFRYALPFSCRMPQADWDEFCNAIRWQAESKGAKVYDIIEDRGVDIVKPSQQLDFIHDAGLTGLFHHAALDKLNVQTSKVARGRHNCSDAYGNSASHARSASFTAAAVAASLTGQFFTDLNQAWKTRQFPKWARVAREPPLPEPLLPFYGYAHPATVADRILDPDIGGPLRAPERAAGCTCPPDVDLERGPCSACLEFHHLDFQSGKPQARRSTTYTADPSGLAPALPTLSSHPEEESDIERDIKSGYGDKYDGKEREQQGRGWGSQVRGTGRGWGAPTQPTFDYNDLISGNHDEEIAVPHTRNHCAFGGCGCKLENVVVPHNMGRRVQTKKDDAPVSMHLLKEWRRRVRRDLDTGKLIKFRPCSAQCPYDGCEVDCGLTAREKVEVNRLTRLEHDWPETHPDDPIPEECDYLLRIVLEGGHMPIRGTDGSAGLDLIVPTMVSCAAGKVTKISLGLRMALPRGTFGIIASRSSLAAKGLTVAGGIVDNDYRNLVSVVLYNFSPDDHQFYAGDRCAQLLILCSPFVDAMLHRNHAMVQVNQLEATTREGGFGSTGRKATEHGPQEVLADGIPFEADVISTLSAATGLSKIHTLEDSGFKQSDWTVVLNQPFSFRIHTVHPWEEKKFEKLLGEYPMVVRHITFPDATFIVDKLVRGDPDISECFVEGGVMGAYVMTSFWVPNSSEKSVLLQRDLHTKGDARRATAVRLPLPALRRKDYQRLYRDNEDRSRVRQLIDQHQLSIGKVVKAWQHAFSFLDNRRPDQEVRAAFEDALADGAHRRRRLVHQFSSRPTHVSFDLTAKRLLLWLARRSRRRTVADDCCWLHLVHNPACWICLRLSQVAHISARGTSSLMRGRMSGMIVIYCDLKLWPTSLRGNRYTIHFVVFTECSWDEKEEMFRSDKRADFTFPTTNKNWECFVYALRCLLTEARITPHDWWFIHIDNEAAAVKSVDAQAFVTMMGGDIMTSLPYLHNYVAENAVRRHSRIIWAILYHSGVGITGWDDVAESWWMWTKTEIMQCVRLRPLSHVSAELKPAFSEVVDTHRALRPKIAFYGASATIRLPDTHPIVKSNKYIGLNGNVKVRVTGIDRRTTVGVRIVVLVLHEGEYVERYTVVPYDSLNFTGEQDREPSDILVEKYFPPDPTQEGILAYDEEIVHSVVCRRCGKWRVSTQEHRENVDRIAEQNLALSEDERLSELDSCAEIPMPVTGMTVYYACLYPEERYLSEDDADTRANQRQGQLPWHETYHDERRADGDDPIAPITPDGAVHGPDPPPPDPGVDDGDGDDLFGDGQPDGGDDDDGQPPDRPDEGGRQRRPRGQRSGELLHPYDPNPSFEGGRVDRPFTRSQARDLNAEQARDVANARAIASAKQTPRAKPKPKAPGARRRPPSPPRYSPPPDLDNLDFNLPIGSRAEAMQDEIARGFNPNPPRPAAPAPAAAPAAPAPAAAPAGAAAPSSAAATAGTAAPAASPATEERDPNDINFGMMHSASRGDRSRAAHLCAPAAPTYVPYEDIPDELKEELDDVFNDYASARSSEPDEDVDFDYQSAFDDEEFIEEIIVPGADSRSYLSQGLVRDLVLCARRGNQAYKHKQRRMRRTEAKRREALGETGDLIGHHDNVPERPSRIKLKQRKQKQAIRELLDFQKRVGAPQAEDVYTDHSDPLVSWVARVTKTLTKREAASDDYNWLDWDGGIQKECKTMRNFGVFGDVYPSREAKKRPYFNLAKLLGAWAVKNSELDKSKWDPRYRAVFGGNDTRRADGTSALYATSASLPASLRDLRLFTVVASLYSWVVKAGDVTGAYLNASAPPDTFVIPADEQVDHILTPDQARRYRQLKAAGENPVVELKKALYGHTQAGFLWEAEARRCLLKMGFVNFTDISSAWYCHYNEAGKLDCMLLLYVDDFMIAGNPHTVRDIVAKMKAIWELKGGDIHDIGDAPIVGTQFQQNIREEGKRIDVLVDQRAYSRHVVDQFFEMTGAAPSSLPKNPDLPAVASEQNVIIDVAAPLANGEYAPHGASLVGKFMWLCRTGLFQLTVAVHIISRSILSWSTQVDVQCKRLIAYIRAHHEGVLLCRVAPADLKQEKLKLLVFSDADHAGDVSTRKSVSGSGIVLSGPNGTWSLIDWVSRSQRTISLSTAEAELLAAQVALRETLTILLLLEILQIPVQVELLVDSSAALSVLLTGLSSKLRYSAKSQGLAAAWCAAVLRDFGIRARKVATDHNLSDIFTKAVDKFAFQTLVTLCGWVSPTEVAKPRCTSFHPSPAHDEDVRCLNFVDKEGGVCEACQRPQGCRCFNGASQWDIRVKEDEDRIPLKRATCGARGYGSTDSDAFPPLPDDYWIV
ncbi:MAG: hypothetical protein CL936_14935 [Deltaproteobacteria bacterium]|nr:hypothetical protein [Deltaproteobacteria bacterium]